MTSAKRRAWLDGAKVVFYFAFAMAVAVYLTVRWGSEIEKVNWRMVTIMMTGATVLYLFYRWSKDPTTTFDITDAFLNPVTRRVDPWRIMIWCMFGFGLWTLIGWVLKDHAAGDITNLFLIMMGAFGIKVVSSDWADAKAGRQPSVAEEPEQPKG